MKKVNFSEIYNEIYAKYNDSLEIQRKKVLTGEIIVISIIVLGLLLCFIYMSEMFIYCLCLLGLAISLIVLIFNWIAKNYVNAFKATVIKDLINGVNPTYKYLSKKGMAPREYKRSGFDNNWDNFYSEDYIEGNIENNTTFKMSQLKTERVSERTDANGHTTRAVEVTFLGLYGIITLPISTTKNVKIFGNFSLNKFQKNRVEMESEEFEKYYDVFSEDRQGAMELLSFESIAILNKIRNDFKKPVNIIVDGKYIYFRIECKDIFEPPTFKSVMDFDLLYNYFKVIDLPRAIYESIIDNALIINGNEIERLNRNLNNKQE